MRRIPRCPRESTAKGHIPGYAIHARGFLPVPRFACPSPSRTSARPCAPFRLPRLHLRRRQKSSSGCVGTPRSCSRPPCDPAPRVRDLGCRSKGLPRIAFSALRSRPAPTAVPHPCPSGSTVGSNAPRAALPPRSRSLQPPSARLNPPFARCNLRRLPDKRLRQAPRLRSSDRPRLPGNGFHPHPLLPLGLSN
jgi:hypothetical protein